MVNEAVGVPNYQTSKKALSLGSIYSEIHQQIFKRNVQYSR